MWLAEESSCSPAQGCLTHLPLHRVHLLVEFLRKTRDAVSVIPVRNAVRNDQLDPQGVGSASVVDRSWNQLFRSCNQLPRGKQWKISQAALVALHCFQHMCAPDTQRLHVSHLVFWAAAPGIPSIHSMKLASSSPPPSPPLYTIVIDMISSSSHVLERPA